jgi:hypothetical protein
MSFCDGIHQNSLLNLKESIFEKRKESIGKPFEKSETENLATLA